MEMGRMEQIVIKQMASILAIPQRTIFLWGLASLFLMGCKKAEQEPNLKEINKTVLVYISANNDLKYSALKSIDQMESSYLSEYGNLLVYIKTDRYNSYILKIKSNKEVGVIASDTIATYSNQNASDPIFMKMVLEDMKELSPSKNYGLVLWSHGTSWLPNLDHVSTKSFGYDRGVETTISDLKDVIPSGLSFILFDACYMSSVEVVYELKDKTDYIIASNAEVLNTSFPYDEIVPNLFGNIDDMKDLCQKYFNFYNNKKGIERSCTVSLISTKELDQLANQSKELIENNPSFKIDRNVQDFNFLKEIPIEFFDYLSLFEKNFQKTESQKIGEIINKCILYKAATPTFLNIPIKEFSGLSISVPIQQKYQAFYKDLLWYKQANVNFF